MDSRFENDVANSGAGHNDGVAQGGGIFAEMGNLRIERTSLTENSANNSPNSGGRPSVAQGGGLYSRATTLRLNNVTIAENRATGGNNQEGGSSGADAEGGGLFSARAGVFLSQLIVIDNEARRGTGGGQNGNPEGGGLYLMGATQIDNVILAGNQIVDGATSLDLNDCHQNNSIDTLGFNLVQTPGNCLFSAPTDRVDLDPDLGPPTDNLCVLATPSRCLWSDSPNPGSPAIDQDSCSTAGRYVDTRSFSRPSDLKWSHQRRRRLRHRRCATPFRG